MPALAGIVSFLPNQEKLAPQFLSLIQSIPAAKNENWRIEEKTGRFCVGVLGNHPVHHPSRPDASSYFSFIAGDLFLPQGFQKNFTDLWMQAGKQSLSQIHGWFTGLLASRQGSDLHVFNSYLGMMPLYYSLHEDWFIFSTSLSAMIQSGLIPLKINRAAVLEYLLYNYPLGEHTFIENVHTLSPATIIHIYTDSFSLESYANHWQLLRRDPLPEKTGIDNLDQVMKRLAKIFTPKQEPLALSLTAGWDSRLLLSYFLGETRDICLYTFGRAGSAEMTVPASIARKFNLRHIPVPLDQAYAKTHFSESARETILYSDGLRGLNRVHYLYAMKKIGALSSRCITGNGGSNLIKIVRSPSPAYNRRIRELFAGPDRAGIVARHVQQIKDWGIMEVSRADQEELLTNINRQPFFIKADYQLNERFYYFLLTQAERKYFGSEAASYSHYIRNFSFYCDREFLNALSQMTIFAGNLPFFCATQASKLKSAQLYAILMSRNNPLLAGFTTDRGYALKDFLTWTGRVKIAAVRLWRNPRKIRADCDYFQIQTGLREYLTQRDPVPENYFDISRLLQKIGWPEMVKKEDTILNALSLNEWIRKIRGRGL